MPPSHQLRRRDFEEVVTKEIGLADIARAERSKPRRSVSHSTAGAGRGGRIGRKPPWHFSHGGGVKEEKSSVVTFRIYAPAVFRAMRAAMDIDQEDFLAVRAKQTDLSRLASFKHTTVYYVTLQSVSPETDPTPYLQYNPSSKSDTSLLFTWVLNFLLWQKSNLVF